MMKVVVLALSLATILLCIPSLQADTIYRWTDDQGVQRFSNQPPPENIKNVEKLESRTQAPASEGDTAGRRPSYDRMVQEASQEAQRLEQRRRSEAAARAAEQKHSAAAGDEKTRSERNRLEQQIEAIEKRALGPTFTNGMKKAQINAIKEQIKALDNDQDTAKSPEQEKSVESESNSGY